jgi:hypothetical protein
MYSTKIVVINVAIPYGTKWQVRYETVNIKNVMVRNGNMALYEIAKSWYEMVFLDTKWTWYETTNSLEPTDWFPFLFIYTLQKKKGNMRKNIIYFQFSTSF